MYSNVGVSVGVEASGLSDSAEDANVFSASGGALSITSGRLSYALGLVGPCYSIDVACASSLAALHVCAAAGIGDVGKGGVAFGTKVLSEAGNMSTSIGGMTSRRGRCHTFDNRADGYCRGEGCVAFVLSSAFGTYVSLTNSAVRQDGPSASLTAPNGSSQKRLIAAVQDGDATVRALEAHGTGTALGDPIEVSIGFLGVELVTIVPQVGAAVGALCEPTAASDGNSRRVQCVSLKSNVGHMEACAGAAGFASLLLLSLGTSMVASNT